METITIVAIVATIIYTVLGSMTWKEDMLKVVDQMRMRGHKKCALVFERGFPLWHSMCTLMNVAMIAYFPGTTIVLCILAIVYMFARQYVKEKYGIEC